MSQAYRLKHVQGRRWSVIDSNDAPVVTGTLRDCEDWLDHWENRTRPQRSLFRRLLDWRRRSKNGDSQAGEPQPSDSRTENAEPNGGR